MNITIKDKEYKLKYTLRALFIFEQATGKAFKLETLTDQYLLFYCMLAANNESMSLTFEDFIDALDEDPTIMIEFLKYLKFELDKQNAFSNKSESTSTHGKIEDSKKKS